jgi:hypothetical protein
MAPVIKRTEKLLETEDVLDKNKSPNRAGKKEKPIVLGSN